jgi:hypothetical protein
MIALIYLVFFALYGLVSVLVIRKAYAFTKGRYSKGWVGGWIVALVMYNLVFWDWIPVYVMHKYYCSTEAGFWVYKSPEQWIKENPEAVGMEWGVNEIKKHKSIDENTSISWASDRIYMEYTKTRSFNDQIGRSEHVLIDDLTDEPLARAVEFTRGAGPNYLSSRGHWFRQFKIWLLLGHRYCGPADSAQGFLDLSSNNRYQLEQLGKGKIND